MTEEEAGFLQPGPFGPLELPGHPIHKGARDGSAGDSTARVLGTEGRQRTCGLGKGFGKVIVDKDESQKSAQGNPGAAGALAEQLESRSGAALQDEGSRPVSNPHPDSSTPQSLSPLSLALSPSGVPEFSAQVQEPLC